MTSVNVIRTFAFAILGVYAFGLPAAAAGLDCTKAKSKVERLICDEKKNPDLYSLDSRLNVFYGEALERVGNETNRSLVEEQKKWIKEVRNVCNDAECLRKVYKNRVSELQEIATLCKAEEIVVFSCTLPGRKAVSLCASQDASPNTGYMQYRLGRNQQDLEMQFPQQKSPAKKHFKYLGTLMEGTRGVSFWSGEDRFSVFDTKAKLAIYDHAGLIVSHGHPPVRASYSECVREPVVFSGYQEYSPTTIYSLDKVLGLPDAGSDISYATGEVELNPGESEE